MASAHKVSAGQRRQMIAEAAYFRAEKRGFDGGDPVADWYAAESEVDARIRELEAEAFLAGLDEIVIAATTKLASLKRRMANLTAEARAEWQRDADRLAELRDVLRDRLGELRERGGDAAQKVRQHADKIGAELTELLRKVAAKH